MIESHFILTILTYDWYNYYHTWRYDIDILQFAISIGFIISSSTITFGENDIYSSLLFFLK